MGPPPKLPIKWCSLYEINIKIKTIHSQPSNLSWPLVSSRSRNFIHVALYTTATVLHQVSEKSLKNKIFVTPKMPTNELTSLTYTTLKGLHVVTLVRMREYYWILWKEVHVHICLKTLRWGKSKNRLSSVYVIQSLPDEKRFSSPFEHHIFTLWDLVEVDFYFRESQHIGCWWHHTNKLMH